METMVESLPDWSATTNPNITLDVAALARAAASFVRMEPAERQSFVSSYSAQFCDPDVIIGPASGLYVLLRVAYELSESLPRHQAKVFGGWLHPSIGTGEPTFDMSWPVHIRGGQLQVERCRGYVMGAYDAASEAQYFAENFALRPTELLDSFAERSGPAIA